MSQTITIGSGTDEKGIPMNPYYGYSYSQSIFDQSEIATNGDIDKIRYYFNGNDAFTEDPVDIYIGHTSKSTFSGSTDWVAIGTLTQVYSGSVTTTATAGWVEIDITDFTYNNTDNLIIVLHEAQPGFHTSSDDYYASSCTGNKTIYKCRDSPAIDVALPPSGTTQAFRPNIQLVITGTTPMTYDSSDVTQGNTETLNPGELNKEIACIEIVTTGTSSQIDLTQLTINMTGSTDGTNDVSNIDIFYTGVSSIFATSTTFGTGTPAGGSINITGNQSLLTGSNFFWIAYDIDAGATIGNFVDAECTLLTLSGAKGTETPTNTAPAGKREIIGIPPVYLMNNTAESTCYGKFFDSGGSASNYSDNQNYVKTFCSDNGENLRFDFTSFDLQLTWDYLAIYDGPTTLDTKIGSYTSVVPITIISSGTCLTFHFESNLMTNKSGWEADLVCFDSGVCGVNPNASDLCADAPLLASTDGICGTTGGYSATDLTGTNLQSETCSGLNFIENNSWLQFTAAETTVELAIICNCPSSGVEVSVFETADCITFVEHGCYNPFYNAAPGVFKVTGLTVGNDYHMMIDQFSNAGCGFKINGLTGVVLPIELKEFKAIYNKNAVEITWITETETNNAFFTIEKSTNGIDFYEIEEIKGAGNSNEMKHYNTTDYDLTTRDCYYRLKQTDFNGRYSHSDIVYVNFESNIINKLTLFPNPVDDILNISFNANLDTDYIYEISDCFGRIVLKGVFEKGASNYKTDLKNQIESGVYLISVHNDANRFDKKIIKN